MRRYMNGCGGVGGCGEMLMIMEVYAWLWNTTMIGCCNASGELVIVSGVYFGCRKTTMIALSCHLQRRNSSNQSTHGSRPR